MPSIEAARLMVNYEYNTRGNRIIKQKKCIDFRKSTWLWIGGATIILFLVDYPKPNLCLP